jgi:6-phosphogluconolactonase (cycloisomerase 2 family)
MQSSSRYNRYSLLTSVLSIAVLVLCLASAGLAQLNLVYVESNIGLCPGCAANHNSIIAFSNDGTGNLKAVKGMPFKTKGTGIYDAAPGVDFAADRELIINPEGTLLFAVNMHSNTIAVFTINSDGSLTAAAGSPFASNGTQPASLGLLDNVLPSNGSILMVANKDSDPAQTQTAPNFSSFTVSSTGVMTLNANGTLPLPTGSSPSNIAVNQKGALMFGVQYVGTGGSAVLGSYRIKSDGSMNLINSLNPPGISHTFLGIAQHPVFSGLYAGLPDINQVGVYLFGKQSGTISFARVVNNGGSMVSGMTVNAAGTKLYTAETGSGTVTVYDLTDVLTPTIMQHVTLAAGGSFGPTNIALDPTGQFLYVLTGSQLHVLNVAADGTLTETATARSLPLRPGSVAVGLATLLK